MPIALINSGRNKKIAQLREQLTRKDIEQLIADPEIEVFQTTTPIPQKIWNTLNQELFSQRPDVKLRLYRLHEDVYDLTFLSAMTNLRRLSVDSFWEVSGIKHISEIPKLDSLSIGIYSLNSFDFLETVAPELTSLSLSKTRSKKPGLAPLARFKKLRNLYLEGQQKQIEVISELQTLENVTLRSISTPDITYLRPLTELWSLDIKLGGIKDLTAIAGMSGIKYLELWQVRGLADISVVATLTGLQYLFLQSLPHVTNFPDLSSCKNLRRILLESMKGFRELKELRSAPALEELAVIDGSHLSPIDFKPLFEAGKLKAALIGLGSDRKNTEILELMANYSIGKLDSSRFTYRKTIFEQGQNI